MMVLMVEFALYFGLYRLQRGKSLEVSYAFWKSHEKVIKFKKQKVSYTYFEVTYPVYRH